MAARLAGAIGWSTVVLGLVLATPSCGGRFTGESGTGGQGATGGANGGSSAGGSAGSSGRGGSAGVGGRAGASGSGSGGVSGSGSGGVSGGSGGVGGGSGGASGGGTGGTGGSCDPGGMCAAEGETCTGPGCCACLYRCSGGRWQPHACPSCPQPVCPADVPRHGDVCDACFVPSQSCTYGGCPQTVASCVDNRWQVDVEPCGGCCTQDSECGGSNLCVSTVCKTPTGTGCWRDDQCGPGSFCSGAFVCPCTADCAVADTPGLCVPVNAGCCRTNADCAAGGQCVSGVCKAPPPEGCWTNRDCQSGVCNDASICPCGALCVKPDVPGRCG